MELLQGWYPGFGEVETIRRMDPVVQEFLADAVSEDPDFLHEYVLPTLEGYSDPEERILSDLSDAIMAHEMAEMGLGDYEGNLGNLGKSFFKKVGKAIKKVAKKISKPIIQVHKKAFEAAKKVEKKVVRAVEKTARKAGAAVSKAWQKYGNIFITVLGAVLAPFTGGASLAAAAAITAANTMYQKKRAADQAKRAGRAEAAQLAAEAAAAEAETMRQVDAFYSQNQQWFVDQLGVTPDKWAQLTLTQKIDLINAGVRGRAPSGTPSEPIQDTGPSQVQQPVQQPPGGGGGYTPSSGGGSAPPPGGGGGGGGGYPEGTSSSGFTPFGRRGEERGVAQAGMFSGNMIPLLAAGVALALVFGKSVKGGGRTRRNPRRRHRRVA